MTDKSKDQSPPESMNTRWWESYLVRYFIGFIVGAGCVATIASQFATVQSLSNLVSVSKDGKPDWSVIFLTLSLAGLGYCYLASTPITVLHAGRYGRGSIDGQSRYFWLSWILVLLISSVPGFTSRCVPPAVGVLVVICFLALIVYCHSSFSKTDNKLSQKKRLLCYAVLWFCLLLFIVLSINFFLPLKTSKWVLPVLILGFPIIWIGLVQYAVLWRLLFEQQQVEDFYKKLFYARRQPNARDVRDTYTHLREHSNSVFIVLVEVCLLALIFSLIKIQTIIQGNAAIDLASFLQLLGVGVAVWVLPTVFMWSRANAMESSFSDDPASFLDFKSTEKSTTAVQHTLPAQP